MPTRFSGSTSLTVLSPSINSVMTIIHEDALGEFHCITIENEIVRMRLLPELGAKMTSLVRLESGHEFLLQPQRPLRRASYGDPFADFDTSGFDECVPTVSACRLRRGAKLPDHGELWSVPWQAIVVGDRVRFSAAGRALPYMVSKTVRLETSEIVIDYELVNEGNTELKFLWSAHPLLTVEPGSRIVLPPDVKELAVNYSLGDRLGHAGATCGWPLTGTAEHSERLDVVGSPALGFADKLFTGRLSEGYCALVKPEAIESIVFQFDPAMVPYVGLWICQGGWPDLWHGHYTVALEPCTGRSDSLCEAIACGQNDSVAPRATKCWTLRIQVKAAANVGDLC